MLRSRDSFLSKLGLINRKSDHQTGTGNEKDTKPSSPKSIQRSLEMNNRSSIIRRREAVFDHHDQHPDWMTRKEEIFDDTESTPRSLPDESPKILRNRGSLRLMDCGGR